MRSIRKNVPTVLIMLTIILAATLGACKKDNTAPSTITYPLQVKDQLGVSGTITFTQTSSTITTVDIVVTGGDMVNHPAYIRTGAAIETGPIAITLNPVVGGKSTTQVTAQDNASAINYSQFLGYDGYVDIDESSTGTSIIAQGDIGGNALTTTTKNYVLDSVGAFGVSGTALFTKRTNGNTLVSITLTGGIAGGVYPAAIHLGSVTTVGGGPVVKTLASIDGTTGKSYTNIRALDSGTAITYDGLLVYDGYIAVQQSATLATTICQGNIGSH